MARSECLRYPARALRASDKEIRILNLLPESAGTDTRCTLNIFPLDDTQAGIKPPAFEALSYTWGKSSLGETIRLNNEDHFPVTDNLAAALRRLRYPRDARRLWIDALCINQLDIAERSQQVSRMRAIYTFSERTVVWLGEPRESTGEQSPRAALSPDDGFAAFDSALLMDTLPRPYWWTRAWVVQELALSSNDPVVLAGRYHLSWSELLALFEEQQPVQAAAARLEYLRAQISLNGLLEMRVRLAETGRSSLPLLVLHTELADATLSKDKVYSLMGLMTADEEERITPDYSRSNAQVYGDAMRAAITARGNFDILKLARIDTEDEPLTTWMIDFDPYGMTLQRYLQMQEYLEAGESRPLRRRNSTHSAEIVSFSPDMRLLSCKGVFLDQVGAVSNLPRPNRAPYAGNLYKEFQVFIEPLPHCDPYHALLNRQHPDPPESRPGDSHAHMKTDWPNVEHSSPWLTSEDFKGYVMASVLAAKLFQSWSDQLPPDRRSSHRQNDVTIESSSMMFEGYSEYRSHGDGDLYLTRTKGGFLGCATEGIKGGDCMVLLDGSFDPVVLRKCEDGKYTFHGMAHIHGMMNGELDALLPHLAEQEFVIK